MVIGVIHFDLSSCYRPQRSFYTCLSFCSQGGVADPPPEHTHPTHIHLAPSRGRHPPEQTPTPTPEQTPPPFAVYAGKYEQKAGGTHPTGMHTCFWVFPHGHLSSATKTLARCNKACEQSDISLGCGRLGEFLQNFSECQILWSLCSVVFHALTLRLHIQTVDTFCSA